MINFLKKIIIKIKIILFFILNPKFIKGLLPLIIDFIYRRKTRHKDRESSKRICKEKSISTLEALKFILNKNSFENFNKIFSKEILIADKAIKDSNIKLGGAGELDLIYWLVKIKKIKYSLETGVASGWSSLAILLAQKDIKNSLLISIDMPYPWIKDSFKYVGLAVPKWLRGKWELIRENDRIGLPKAFDRNIKFGLVHYDSDKSVYGKKWALNYIYSKLEVNSIFLVDDIGDNLTFHEFVKENNLKHLIVNSKGKFIGIIII